MAASHVLERLKQLDLEAMRASAMEDIRSGKKTRRAKAVKLLRAIEGIERSGVKLGELAINRVPVIPPAFRPYAVAGETFIPGDANELYSDLVRAKDIHQQSMATFGEAGSGVTAQYLRDSVRAAYGYGSTPNPKLKARGVSGFLTKILGSGPKTSFVQQKLLAKPQDMVGGAVISPDPDLGMDEVGVPREMAWTVFRDFIQRRLVSQGIPASRALRLIKDRDTIAERALIAEMKERPVMISRAPAWHKQNYVAGWGSLVDGNNLMISPYITAGIAGDFDGDSQFAHVRILRKKKVDPSQNNS